MMTFARYDFIRNRLIFLYNLVQHRGYRVHIAPEKMMTLEQIRARPTYTQEGFANDHDYYSEMGMRVMRIPMILQYMENLTSADDLHFERYNKVIVEIYEGLTEYIALWCEVIKNAPDFKAPTFQELRELESLAYLLFNKYKSIKPFVKREADQKTYAQDEQLEGKGLAGFRALFGLPSMVSQTLNGTKDGISFYSPLDELTGTSSHPSYDTYTGPAAPMYNPAPFNPEQHLNNQYLHSQPVVPFDSLFSNQPQMEMNPEWIFKEG